MLSRVAESMYWMSRYIERAENVARFVDVNLDADAGFARATPPSSGSRSWTSPATRRNSSRATGRPPSATSSEFLTFDTDNVNSIVSCLRAARENARSVREVISSEMWEQLNESFLMVSDAARHGGYLADPQELFASVKMASHLFAGVTDATMTHGEGWHFCQLGRMLERADKTSRIIDVKYFLLLPTLEDVGTTVDDMQWAAVLRSASALEMYSQAAWPHLAHAHRRVPAARPRLSAGHSLLPHGGEALGPRDFRHTGRDVPDRRRAGAGRPLLGVGLRTDRRPDQGWTARYLDVLQDKMNQVGTGIHDTFFAARVVPPTAGPTARRRSVSGIDRLTLRASPLLGNRPWPFTSRSITRPTIATTVVCRSRPTSSGCVRHRTAGRRF